MQWIAPYESVLQLTFRFLPLFPCGSWVMLCFVTFFKVAGETCGAGVTGPNPVTLWA